MHTPESVVRPATKVIIEGLSSSRGTAAESARTGTESWIIAALVIPIKGRVAYHIV